MSAILSNAEQAALSVLEMLKHAQKRPAMYIAPIDFFAAENFLAGVGIGVSRAIHRLCEINVLRQDVKRARGYNTIALNVFESELRSRFPACEQVVNELFEIEIEAWNRLLKSLRTTTSTTTA